MEKTLTIVRNHTLGCSFQLSSCFPKIATSIDLLIYNSIHHIHLLPKGHHTWTQRDFPSLGCAQLPPPQQCEGPPTRPRKGHWVLPVPKKSVEAPESTFCSNTSDREISFPKFGTQENDSLIPASLFIIGKFLGKQMAWYPKLDGFTKNWALEFKPFSQELQPQIILLQSRHSAIQHSVASSGSHRTSTEVQFYTAILR